jgi:hypothetical protein
MSHALGAAPLRQNVKRMSTLTTHELSRRLGCDRITEQREPVKSADGEVLGYHRCFRVHPQTSSTPDIWFSFNEDGTSLVALSFGEWHYEPYGKTDDQGFQKAVAYARQIIRGQRCVLEHLSATGACVCVALIRRNRKTDVLGPDVRRLRRTFFGRAPITEAV